MMNQPSLISIGRINSYMKTVMSTPAKFLILALALSLWCNPAAASGLTPLNVADKLQQSYNDTTTLTANFRQISRTQMQRRQRKASGTIVISKPGRIRWDYLQPDPLLLMINKDIAFMYQEKERKMMKVPADRYLSYDVACAFFIGNGNIQRDFTIQEPEDIPFLADGQYCITLIPRNKHPQLNSLNLWIDSNTWLIRQIRLADQVGSITDLFFTNIIINQPVPDETFLFTPPPDTEIIEQ